MAPALRGPEILPTNERRTSARADSDMVECDRGVVFDISAGGLQLQSKRLLAGDLDIVLTRGADVTVGTRARVVWSQRMGFGYLSGLQFIDLETQAAQELLPAA